MSIKHALRAIVKGGFLFILFNIGYFLCQPVQMGRLPTLYNTLFPGRVRFLTDTELNIDRVLADHIIQRATPATWNVMILGSSEMRGARNQADTSTVAYLDSFNVSAQDGRPVRFYNVAYPQPDISKDLMIADHLLAAHLPIDLVMIHVTEDGFTNPQPATFVRQNPKAAFDLQEAYHLSDTFIKDMSRPKPSTLWDDRADLGGWLGTQAQGFAWMMTRYDNLGSGPLASQSLSEWLGENDLSAVTRAEFLPAFAVLREKYHVPILLINMPRPYTKDAFVPWLYDQSQVFKFPVLNCEFVFDRPQQFRDFIHLVPAIHPLYAHILAQQFSQPEMSAVSPQMPLRLPPDVVTPEGQKTCEFIAAP